MQVHFFAAARAAAGTAELSVAPNEIDSPTLGSLIAHLGRELTGTTPSGLTLAQVMEQCSFLINGTRSDADAPLDSPAVWGTCPRPRSRTARARSLTAPCRP